MHEINRVGSCILYLKAAPESGERQRRLSGVRNGVRVCACPKKLPMIKTEARGGGWGGGSEQENLSKNDAHKTDDAVEEHA